MDTEYGIFYKGTEIAISDWQVHETEDSEPLATNVWKAENFKAQIIEINNIMPPIMTINCEFAWLALIVAENCILKNTSFHLGGMSVWKLAWSSMWDCSATQILGAETRLSSE